MRWFKKIVRAILNLLPVLFVIFLTTPVSALKHQYVSIPFYYPPDPQIEEDTSTGKYHLTGRAIGAGSSSGSGVFSSSFQTGVASPFQAVFLSDNWTDSMANSSVFSSGNSNKLQYFNSNSNSNNNCVYFSTYGGSFQPIFNYFRAFSGNFYTVSVDNNFQRIPSNSYITDLTQSSYGINYDFTCKQLGAFNRELPQFDLNSFGSSFLTQRYDATIAPYSYGADGFYSISKTVKDGIHYSDNFNFAKIFGEGNYLNKFSSLQFSLFDEKQSIDYYQGRQIEFNGSFTFESPFTLSQTAIDSGHFYINFSGITDDGVSYSHNIQCTLNQRSVEALNYYALEYSCPWTVDHNYIWTTQIWHMDAIPDSSVNDPSQWSYVWDTSGRWIWSGESGAGQYITTDNDDTPGASINSERTGNHVPNDASNTFNPSNNIVIDGQDFSASLINLFGFTFINPFVPIFNLFNSGSNCVQIPTIAGMIHSEESQVCPWFDSSVRNIVTPVLGISSMMLVFGFAVRWLGSSSGNLFEDSSNETLAPPGYSGHWGRRKK